MTEDPEVYPYTPFLNMAIYWERPSWMWMCPLAAQPFAGVAIVIFYCYESIWDPRGRPDAGYGTLWFWITFIAFVVPTLWTIYGYIEHRLAETERARAWPAELAAKRAAEAEKLRLQREAADKARREELAKREAEASAARQARLAELEMTVLNLRGQVAAKVDFFGDSDPASVLASVRRAVLNLPHADLSLLRESRHPLVREIIGDGACLPPYPHPLLPSLKTL